MKKIITFSLLLFLLCTPFLVPSYAGSSNKIPVLLYHHILADAENTNQKNNGAVLSLENFEKQMKYLYDNGYNTITLKELQDYLYKHKPLPPKSVLITFDDGYYSNITRAYPVLKKYDFRASIFLITSYIHEKQAPFDPTQFTFIAKESLSSVKDVFEFASHTNNLHKSSDTQPNKTLLVLASKQEILDDIRKSWEILDFKTALAYPQGQYNSTVLEALPELPVYMGFTVKPGYITKDSYGLELNRFIIFQRTSFETFKKIVRGSAT